MSDEGDTFWVSLSEKFVGLILIILGALMLYYTATTADLGTFGAFFGVLSVVMLIIGVFLLIVKPPK
jgi:Zn-dependent protease